MTDKFYIVTTNSFHRLTYLVKGPTDIKIEEMNTIIAKHDDIIELEQKWNGEEVIEIKQLTDEQVAEIIPPNLIELNEDIFIDEKNVMKGIGNSELVLKELESPDSNSKSQIVFLNQNIYVKKFVCKEMLELDGPFETFLKAEKIAKGFVGV